MQFNNEKKESISIINTTILITAAGSVNSACNYKLGIDQPWFLNIGSSLAISEIKKKTNLK